MKNSNALQIFSILSVLVIIILVVVLVMFNNAWEEHDSKMKDAVGRAAEAEKREREAKMDMLTLKQLIGHRDETDTQTIQTQFETDMMRYAKGDTSSKNYRIALANLSNELAKKNEEHKNTNEDLLDLKVNFDNLNVLYETVVNQFAEERAKAVTDLANERKTNEGALAEHRKQMDVLTVEKTKIVQEAEEQVKAANKKAEEKEIEAKQISNRNNELATVIDDLRRTNFDRPDGKILSVNQQSGMVIVNLGSEDGLMTRMTFSVYPPTITGISFGATDPDQEVVICEVCKREVSLNANKASIEIVRILGPHKSEARILDDQLTNPIVANDVIHTPIWKPGQRQRFALASGMRIPGIGKRDGGAHQSHLEEIKRLIASNGAIVDAYIGDGTEEGIKRGEVVGEITRDTTFLVIGDLDDEDQQDQEMMEAQAKLIKSAEQYAAKQISLRELLARMAWKNVTPVRGFGKFANESDHDIKPTGEHRASTSPVSPLYQLRNDKARLTNSDRTSSPSTGRVSGLYGDVPSTTRSTGKTSDLFRPRKAGSTRTELSE